MERRITTGAERSTATAAKQLWQAVGHESFAGIMILASAMSHIVGRPAMSMEGGPLVLWRGKPAAVWNCPEITTVI